MKLSLENTFQLALQLTPEQQIVILGRLIVQLEILISVHKASIRHKTQANTEERIQEEAYATAAAAGGAAAAAAVPASICRDRSDPVDNPVEGLCAENMRPKRPQDQMV
jgi:hypothetical protein